MPLLSWWRASARRREFEAGMAEELRFHLESETERLMRSGLTRREAERRARLEFGSMDAHQEECRQARGLRMQDELWNDLRYAFRMIRHRPGFSLTAILFLGLAIGVNTTAFSFVNAYLFRPLPVSAPDRHMDLTAFGAQHRMESRWSDAQRVVLQRQSESIAELYSIERATVALIEDRPAKLEVEVVSENFLPLLGARILRGRSFADVQEPAGVLSYAGWKHRFGGDPAIVGRRIRLGRNFLMVVGIADPSFLGVELVTPDLWVPERWRGLVMPPNAVPEFQLGGILHPAVSIEHARSVLTASLAQLNEGAAGPDRLAAVAVDPRSVLSRVEDGNVVITGVVGCAFLLLIGIACANLASLHLAGAYARQRELAIRLSLGATRMRIVRQLLVEALVLSALGGVLALLLTYVGVGAVESFAYQVFARVGMNMTPIGADWRVALFAGAMSIAAALAFGLLPALEATGVAGIAARQQGGITIRKSGPSRMRLVLIAGQTAANLVLLVIAGILFVNAGRLDQVSPGFSLASLYDTGVERHLAEYQKRLAADPRIAGVTGVFRIPLWGMMYPIAATVDRTKMTLAHNYVDHRFFDTMGIAITRGRSFTAAEAETKAGVAIVSEATARLLWPGREALGQTIELDGVRHVQVVGLAKDVISGMFFVGIDRTLVYLPAAVGSAEVEHLIIRAGQPGGRLAAELQQACLDLDAASFCEPKPFSEHAWLQRFPVRMASQVAMALGLLALVLSCVGLYGVVSLTVVRRTREAGIRMALGATRWMVMRPMMASSLWGVALGIAIGLPLCLVAAKLAESAATYLHLADPAVFVLVPLLLVAVVLAATLIPARKASAADPATALRHD